MQSDDEYANIEMETVNSPTPSALSLHASPPTSPHPPSSHSHSSSQILLSHSSSLPSTGLNHPPVSTNLYGPVTSQDSLHSQTYR